MKPKILIYTCLYHPQPKILWNWMQIDFSVAHCDWLMGIDQPNGTGRLETRPLSERPSGFSPLPYDHREETENHLYKWAKARNALLTLGYDYFFYLEDDIMVPSDILKKLLSADKDIIGGLLRGRPSRTLATFPLLWILDVAGPQDSDDRPAIAGKDYQFGDIVEATNCSLGCTLYKRHVIEKVPKYPEGDYEFYRACAPHGIKLFCHTGVHCTHVEQDGTELPIVENIVGAIRESPKETIQEN